jgi:DNA-binding NarL/FixJ family response regulator
VLLVDDHTLVRAGVRRLLEARPDLEVVGEVADGAATLELLERQPVDIVVLDLSMPGMDGLGVLAEIRGRWPGVGVIVLTMHAGSEYVARAVREGARGYLLKDSAVQDLVTAIDSVRQGGEFYSPAVQRHLADAMREGETSTGIRHVLTPREREVLRLVAEGMPTKQIADVLGISARTVETHRANLMRKLDARSVARLTQLAIREGLIRGS